jgi:hypothetical protein
MSPLVRIWHLNACMRVSIAVLTSVTTMALNKHDDESLGVEGDNLEAP